jgi:hypothetical protein
LNKNMSDAAAVIEEAELHLALSSTTAQLAQCLERHLPALLRLAASENMRGRVRVWYGNLLSRDGAGNGTTQQYHAASTLADGYVAKRALARPRISSG